MTVWSNCGLLKVDDLGRVLIVFLFTTPGRWYSFYHPFWWYSFLDPPVWNRVWKAPSCEVQRMAGKWQGSQSSESWAIQPTGRVRISGNPSSSHRTRGIMAMWDAAAGQGSVLDPTVTMDTLLPATCCFSPCSCPDKLLRIRICLAGFTCADLLVLHLSPSVVPAGQAGGLAEHGSSPGQSQPHPSCCS